MLFTGSVVKASFKETHSKVLIINPSVLGPPHTRARDHCTSSTLIGGQGGAGPSLLHTMLGGPKEYVNARWM